MSVTYPERARCEDIPEFFPTVQMDTRINCLRKVCDLQIHLVLSFDGLLDIARLRRAIRLTLDAEPVLGCRLLERAGKMVWQRRTDLDRLDLLTVVRDVDDVQSATTSYMAQPLNLDHDPLVQAVLFRKNNCDTLCLKVSHVVADGGALGEYGELLASIYCQLGKNPEYLPEPNILGERCIHQVTRQFGFRSKISHFRQLLISYFGELFPRKNWSFPFAQNNDDFHCTYVIHAIDSALYENIISFAKENSFSANDVFMAACYRALYCVIEPKKNIPLRLGTTVNLRRYIPGLRGEALCNLSAMFQLNIGREIGETLFDTASIVNKKMNVIKANDVGMGDKRYFIFDQKWLTLKAARWLHQRHQLFKWLVGPRQVAPLFSNAGVFDNFDFNFGKSVIQDVYVTPPAVRFPFLFMALSGLGSSLKLTSGVYADSRCVDKVAVLFKRIELELRLGVSSLTNES